MGIKNIEKKPNWQTDSSFDHTRIKTDYYKLDVGDIVKSLQRDFQAINPDSPRQLVKDIFERFPFTPSMPAEHPAFKVILAAYARNKVHNLNPLDWQWHKEQLRRARIREATRYTLHKEDLELYLNRLDQQTEIRKEIDRKAAFFANVFENQLKLITDIERANQHQIGQSERLLAWSRNMQDEERMRLFYIFFIAPFTPSKRYLKERAYRIQTNPSLSQQRTLDIIEVTPYELLIQEALKMIPLVRREFLDRVFADFRERINRVHITNANVAQYRKQIAKGLLQLFMVNVHKNHLEDERTAMAHFKSQRTETMLQQNKLKIEDTRKELLDHHLERQAHNAKVLNAYDAVQATNRAVTNIYRQKDRAFQAHQADLNELKPLMINGVTEMISRNPVTYQTQFHIINQWVTSVDAMIDRREGNLDEIVQMTYDNVTNDSNVMNEASYKDAVEAQRVIEAHRARELFQNFSLDQLTQMFAATAEAAKLLQNYQKQNPGIVNEVLEDSKNYAEIKEIPKMAPSKKLEAS